MFGLLVGILPCVRQEPQGQCVPREDPGNESNESNNLREEFWPCDTAPPEITAGPVATNIDESSALIWWTTDEPSDSVVRYGRTAGEFPFEEADPTPVFTHEVALTGLTTLNLEHTEVADTGTVYLRALIGLSSLDLSWTKITDEGLARLGTLTGLTHLTLAGTRITDAGLAHLQPFTDLTHLDLSHTHVGGAGLTHLDALSALTTLNLESTPITDEGLAHLHRFPHLTDLYLGSTDITDVGLILLGALPSLRTLDLTACAGITDAYVSILSRPDLTIMT